jgi:hypothetical protein
METENPSVMEQVPETRHPGRRPAKAKVTIELVQRVANRVENGIPLKIAIAGEGVTMAAYEQQLKKHPELAALQETAKRKFMEFAVKKLLDEEKPAVSIRWLLEHCHPELLAQPGDTTPAVESESERQTITGIPNSVLEQMREHARNPIEHE